MRNVFILILSILLSAEPEILEWPVDANQAAVLTAPQRFINVFATRRFGKTLHIAAPALWTEGLSDPKSFSCYTAPTIAQLDECFHELTQSDIGAELAMPYISKILSRPYRIFWKSGGRTEFRQSGNPLALKGRGYKRVIIDEGQDVKSDKVIRALLPTIADKRDASGNYIGRLMVLGQPRGEDWRYKTFVEGAIRDPKRYTSFTFTALQAWAFMGERGLVELAECKELYGPAVFDEDFMCSLVADTGAAFSDANINNAITPRSEPIPFPRVEKSGRPYGYLLSMDLGRMGDPSCINVFEFSERKADGSMGEIRLAHNQYIKLMTPHSEQARVAKSISHRYGNCMVVVDATGGGGGNKHEQDDVLKWYRNEIPETNLREFCWSPANKRPIMESMDFAMEKGLVRIPACYEQLIKEIRSYRKYKTREGNWTFRGKDNTHDDGVPATAAGLHFINRGWVFMPGNQYKGMM